MVAIGGATGWNGVLLQTTGRLRRHGALRTLMVSGLLAVLTGCGISRQIELGESDPVPANLNDGLAECRNFYPDQITQAVARAACIIKATEILRPMLPFPELLDQENALRKSLAEQVQSGGISLLERNRQMTKFHTKLLAEEQERLRARAAEAKSAAAELAAAEPAEAKPVEMKSAEAVVVPLAVRQWRASNPDGCTSLGGNTANCY